MGIGASARHDPLSDGANDLRHRLETDRAGTFFLDPAYAFALENPWLAPIADLARHSQALQGARRLAARWNVESAERYSDAIPVYVAAQHGINLLAKGMGAARVMVLQPFLAFKEPLSVEENRFTAYRYRDQVMRQLYERTSRELTSLAAHDAVMYLDGRLTFRGVSETVFGDDVHFTSDAAYRRLASWIAASLPAEAVDR